MPQFVTIYSKKCISVIDPNRDFQLIENILFQWKLKLHFQICNEVKLRRKIHSSTEFFPILRLIKYLFISKFNCTQIYDTLEWMYE